MFRRLLVRSTSAPTTRVPVENDPRTRGDQHVDADDNNGDGGGCSITNDRGTSGTDTPRQVPLCVRRHRQLAAGRKLQGHGVGTERCVNSASGCTLMIGHDRWRQPLVFTTIKPNPELSLRDHV